jgi:Type VI secretion system effector, Hcp
MLGPPTSPEKEQAMTGAMGRVRGWLGSHLKLVGVSAITALAVSAALAVATVPDGGGVIHTCYQVTSPGGPPLPGGSNLQVIDPDAPAGTGQNCDPAGEQALNFSQQGPVGPVGAAGAPGTAGSPSTGDDCPAVVGRLKLNASLQSDLCGIAQVKIGSRSAGGPSGPGAATEFELTRRIDALSPKLLNAAVQGTLFQSASILVYKPGTTSVAKTYKLANAAISSVKIGQGQVKPTESLTLISVPKKGT